MPASVLGFSVILHLNTYFYGSISEFGKFCECRCKGGEKSSGKQCMKSDGASRRSNVATSPSRDVPTSRRWVNYCKSQQAVTSRRLNVVTSQRRDVVTS